MMPYLWYIPVKLAPAPDSESSRVSLFRAAYAFEMGEFERKGDEFVHKKTPGLVIRQDGMRNLALPEIMRGKEEPDETLWRYCHGEPLPIWPDDMLWLFMFTLPALAETRKIPSPYRMIFHPTWAPLLDPQWDELRWWGVIRVEPFGASPIYKD